MTILSKKLLLVIAAAVMMAGGMIPAEAKLVLRNPCADGMVLQQKSAATVFGIADPRASVTVQTSWNGKSYSCRADEKGLWDVKVATPAASYTNYTIRVSSGRESVTVRDVLIGEVWLASGQSNMEIPVKGFDGCPVEGYQEAVSAAPMPDRIRMFMMPVKQSFTPEVEVEGRWLKATPDEVPDMSAVAYWFSREVNEVLDVPVGIVYCAYGGSRVEGWLPEEVLRGYGTENLDHDHIMQTGRYSRPFMMYNAMLHPLMGYTIQGFLWYQGCSNVGFDEQFVSRMTDMVRIFRAGFGDTEGRLPFYQVEIAPYVYDADASDSESRAARLRAAQHACDEAIPNLATVVTNDLVAPYEKTNIHPARKRPIGERLAWLALNRTYGFSRIACDSPRAVELTLENGAACIRLEHAERALNRTSGVEGLEMRGRGGAWYPVTSISFNGDTMRLRSEHVAVPAEVRYGWGDFKPGNLANRYGLPLVPFWLKIERQQQ